MQIHQLRPNTPPKRAKRVGRGDKTAGRGTKGQRARAGAKIRPAIRDVIKKLPKLRGRGAHSFRPFRPKPAVLDLGRLAGRFPNGASVDPAALLKAGMVRRMKGRMPAIKVLGSAAIEKQLHLSGVALSRAARARIEEAGGSIR